MQPNGIALGFVLLAAVTFVHLSCTFLSLWVLREFHAERWRLESGITASVVIAGGS